MVVIHGDHKDDTDYTFSVGAVRSLEKGLLSKNSLMDLIDLDLPKFPQFFKETFYEPVFGDEFVLSNSDDVGELFFDKALSKLYKQLSELDIKKYVSSVFQVRYDFFNLKALIKSAVIKEKTPSLFFCGTIQPNIVVDSLKEGKVSKIPLVGPFFAEAMEDLQKHDGWSLQEVDCFIDKRMFEYMVWQATLFKVSFMINLVQVMIDAYNTMFLVRTRFLNGGNIGNIDSFLVAGGKLGVGYLKSISALSIEDMMRELCKKYEYSAIFSVLLNHLGNDLYAFMELLWNKYILEVVDFAKYVVMGAEPLVSYLVKRENEIKSIALILFCRRNGFDTEIIKNKLEKYYG